MRTNLRHALDHRHEGRPELAGQRLLGHLARAGYAMAASPVALSAATCWRSMRPRSA